MASYRERLSPATAMLHSRVHGGVSLPSRHLTLKKGLRTIERAFADIAELADALSDRVRDAERGAGREEVSPPAHHRQAPRPAHVPRLLLRPPRLVIG
jgi:hypothetical protein